MSELEDMTQEEKDKFIEDMFNRDTKDFEEFNFTDEDYINHPDGKVEFIDKELVALIKDAFVSNKVVRFNMEVNSVFIEK